VRETAIHNEPALLQRLAEDDAKAYTEIYGAYFPLLFHTAIRFLKTKPAAEDVCNEVFLKLWQNRHTLPSIQSLGAYLSASVRNRSINALKQLARSHAAVQEVKSVFPAHTIDAEAQYLSKEYIHFIKKEIEQLPARAKQVFTLCRNEGYSYDEVSAQLGISRNAVKGHMVASMKKLKSYAEKDLGISFTILLILLIKLL
jgi:RNA polymerase sigma-70 factor (ECF subfamily)